MPWSLDGTRVFVVNKNNVDKQIIARLQPLAGATKYQVFAYESGIIKIKAYIVGGTDYGAVRDMTKDGVMHAFIQPGFSGNYFVSNISAEELNTVCQTLRTDLPTNSIVYLADIELFRDE